MLADIRLYERQNTVAVSHDRIIANQQLPLWHFPAKGTLIEKSGLEQTDPPVLHVIQN